MLKHLKKCHTVPKVAAPLYVLTKSMKVLISLLYPCRYLFSFLFLFFCYALPSGHEEASLCGFDFIALIINEVEHLFMFLLGSYHFLTEIE